MIKWAKDPRGWTFKRFNRQLGCHEWLAYGGEHGTMNDEPQYFSRFKHQSPLFDNKRVLTLKSVCWMDPKAIFTQIPIPDTPVLKASLFVCHMYAPNFNVNGHFIVRIEGKEIAKKEWSGPKRISNVFIQEHIFDFDMPKEYQGRTVDVRAELLCNTGNWKTGWNFEGFTLAFNSTDKFEQKVFFKHEDATKKKQLK